MKTDTSTDDTERATVIEIETKNDTDTDIERETSEKRSTQRNTQI